MNQPTVVRRSDAEANRVRVLDAARSVLYERGLNFDVGEIALRAGVGKGTIYRNFTTKEEIVDLVVAEIADVFEGLVEDAFSNRDPRSSFLQLLEAHWQFASRFGHIASDLRTRVHVETASRSSWSGVEAVVQRALDNGVLNQEFPTWYILRVISGLVAVSIRVEPDQIDPTGRLSTKLLVEGLMASGQRTT